MEIDLEFEAHDLIDDDQFPEPTSAEKDVGNSFGIDVNDSLPELNESAEPERNRKNGRYNLRKSLAWDSAFFTSAGVLDQDELSSMITGADKSEKPSLPGIQEEITGSTESLSTLESDTLTLEGCEDDLFVDIRASIQRSSKKASNLTNSSRKITAAEIDSTAISSLEKEDCVPIDKSPKLGLKKTSGLQTGRIPKCQPKQIGRLASGKSTKQDSVRSQVASVAKIGEKKLILPKPPKIISSSSIPSSTATAKRDSMGIGRIKSECGSSKLGTFSSKGTQPSKVSVLSGSRKVMPKPAVPSKSSLLGSSTASSVHSVRSSTSSDSSTNSGVPAKSTIMTARRNPVKSGNISTGPSGSIPKTPSRAGPKNKLPASTLSAHLMSTKISSSVSPASSISEWSSASSSCSMATRRSNNNSRTSLDVSSCKSIDGDNSILDARSPSAGPTADRHENQGVILKSSTSKKSTTQAGALHAPAKPSGLRMPSPKIGFFDGSLQMKSPAHTPNGHKQSESGLRTATSIPIRSSNSKLKSPKVPTPRPVNPLANIKPASPKPASPLSFQEKSHASNASSILMDVKHFSSLSPGVKGSATGEPSLKAEEVQAEDGVKQVVDAGTGATVIHIDSLGDSSVYKYGGSEDIETVSCEGSKTSGSEYVDQIGNNVLINQDHVKKNSDSHPICEATEKENVQGLTCDASECALSSPAANRAPFAPKNTSECIDMLKESIIHVAAAEKTGFVLPSSEQKENI